MTRARHAAGRRGFRSLLGHTLVVQRLDALLRAARGQPRVRASKRWAKQENVPEHAIGKPLAPTRGLYLVPAGPGTWEQLVDTVESILHYDANDARIVVLDDCTLDCRAPRVQTRFPEVSVIRARVPTFGAPLSPSFLRAFEIVTRSYDFDVLIKIDTDGLVVGPDLSRSAAIAFNEDRGAGTLGTLCDSRWHEPQLIHSGRWSPDIRALVRATGSRGYNPLVFNHGGVYAISRAALEAAHANGLLRFRVPWWSRTAEDLIFAMLLAQIDYRPRDWEAIASTSMALPAPLHNLMSDQILAVHSVRRGLFGESETTVREFFRARRCSGASAAISRANA